jgi:hypothetical protein
MIVFLMICFLFSIVAVIIHERKQYVKTLSLLIMVYSLITCLFIIKYYPENDKLFNFGIIASAVSYLVYLFSKAKIKW